MSDVPYRIKRSSPVAGEQCKKNLKETGIDNQQIGALIKHNLISIEFFKIWNDTTSF